MFDGSSTVWWVSNRPDCRVETLQHPSVIIQVVTSKNHQAGEGNSSVLDWTDLLLADIELIPQYILEITDGQWECRCGNSQDSDGFEACSEIGGLVPAELGPWDGALQACIRCWRVINGDTLEILGFAEDSAIEKNLEFCWG